MMDIVTKTTAAGASTDPLDYVLSDASVDRFGDIIEPAGWQLANFRKNPIALFGHNSDFIVGNWRNVRVDGDQLLGRLELLAPVSERLQEVHTAVRAGVLRAVSVGFRPLEEPQPIEGSKNFGLRFTKQELVECSLVSVPANPNALQVAKSLNLSRETMDLIFGVPAGRDQSRREIHGVSAAIPPIRRKTPMNISERIERTQARLVSLREELTRHLEDHEEMDDQAIGLQTELNRRIESVSHELEGYRRSEALLGDTAEPALPAAATAMELRNLPAVRPQTDSRPVFAQPQKLKKGEALDLFCRAGAIGIVARALQESPDVIRLRNFGEHRDLKIMSDLVLRAATIPADMTTTGWAKELVQILNADFMELLTASAIYPGLSAAGQRLTFGRAGQINIPTRNSTPTIAGSFVGEGQPIPVRQGAFSTVPVTPKKMAVITTMTREVSEHSIPQLEQLLRQAIQDDTAVSIDVVLLDTNAATSVRPAGIRYNVSVTAATSGGGLTALVGDIKNLTNALLTSTNGNIRRPVWIMNPIQANAIALITNGFGVFPFRDEMNAGRLSRWPVLESSTVTAGMLILIDAADFVSVTGDDMRFDISDQATIHMEDTAPQAIGVSGSPTAPVRSLWQTDSIGIRMVLPMNWVLRRSGVVAWTQSVTW